MKGQELSSATTGGCHFWGWPSFVVAFPGRIPAGCRTRIALVILKRVALWIPAVTQLLRVPAFNQPGPSFFLVVYSSDRYPGTYSVPSTQVLLGFPGSQSHSHPLELADRGPR